MKKLDLARDALLKGDEAVGGASAEIQYTLGLIYFELDDKENALAYARKAYDKNYPLPGLQQKLKRAGYWPGCGQRARRRAAGATQDPDRSVPLSTRAGKHRCLSRVEFCQAPAESRLGRDGAHLDAERVSRNAL